MKDNKKANGFVITLFILIIVVALTFVFLLYFNIGIGDLQDKINGKPTYNFNDKSTIFIQQNTMNKMNYAYDKLNDTSLLCLYGIDKSNGNLFIDDIKETSQNKICFKNDKYLGILYINKNNQADIYDINCALDKSQYDYLQIGKNKITSIMCKKNWLAFYNNESLDRSYDYKITN